MLQRRSKRSALCFGCVRSSTEELHVKWMWWTNCDICSEACILISGVCPRFPSTCSVLTLFCTILCWLETHLPNPLFCSQNKLPIIYTHLWNSYKF
jgi:hypothetical protein